MHCSLEVESSSAYQYVPQSLSTLLIADPFSQQVIHQAPAIFRKTNRNGVPWVSVLAVASVSLLFFGISFLPGGAGEIWTWAQNLVGVSCKLLSSLSADEADLPRLPNRSRIKSLGYVSVSPLLDSEQLGRNKGNQSTS